MVLYLDHVIPKDFIHPNFSFWTAVLSADEEGNAAYAESRRDDGGQGYSGRADDSDSDESQSSEEVRRDDNPSAQYGAR